ncbi:hypothetical protein [Streptomyces chartreusis]|uniref:hypothetical protein n=1 Tax=Streptomyces chartreusis TaxID=1969 RepID=UPI00386A92CC|nr:hypothetical protein OG938_48680 [Streptomyces chartreusis]
MPQPAEQLRMYRFSPNQDGSTRLTLHTYDPVNRTFNRTTLDIEPYIADHFRAAVLREIPERPIPAATIELCMERLAGLSDMLSPKD